MYSLKGIIKTTISCGIGLKASGADEIFISTNQAREALTSRECENAIVFYEETDSDINQDYIISNAIQYIKNNYNEQITLMDVANSIYVNHTYLSHLFKKVTGINL
jgi:YesN/AraC family two-component response regulator